MVSPPGLECSGPWALSDCSISPGPGAGSSLRPGSVSPALRAAALCDRGHVMSLRASASLSGRVRDEEADFTGNPGAVNEKSNKGAQVKGKQPLLSTRGKSGPRNEFLL